MNSAALFKQMYLTWGRGLLSAPASCSWWHCKGPWPLPTDPPASLRSHLAALAWTLHTLRDTWDNECLCRAKLVQLLFFIQPLPDEIFSVLEHLGFTLHGVVGECQTPRVDQQDGEELVLPTSCHLLLIHGVRQGEEQEDTREDGTGSLAKTHAGASKLPCPLKERKWVRLGDWHEHCQSELTYFFGALLHLFRMTAPTLFWAEAIEKRDFCLLRRRSPSTSCCFWVPELPKWKVLARALSSGAGRRSRACANSCRSLSSDRTTKTEWVKIRVRSCLKWHIFPAYNLSLLSNNKDLFILCYFVHLMEMLHNPFKNKNINISKTQINDK